MCRSCPQPSHCDVNLLMVCITLLQMANVVEECLQCWTRTNTTSSLVTSLKRLRSNAADTEHMSCRVIRTHGPSAIHCPGYDVTHDVSVLFIFVKIKVIWFDTLFSGQSLASLHVLHISLSDVAICCHYCGHLAATATLDSSECDWFVVAAC